MAATKKDVWVKTWKVVVNNSGQSNMATVVGRYMTPEAADRVAQAFREALYADPYNYRTEYSRNIETPDAVVADIDVRVESDRADHNLMTAKSILLARQHGIDVLDEHGKPVTVDA
ncbi:MAG: hypothetical protein ABSA67_19660 [Candidatus Brocadiia bacterium]|jgi:hypothetical protein